MAGERKINAEVVGTRRKRRSDHNCGRRHHHRQPTQSHHDSFRPPEDPLPPGSPASMTLRLGWDEGKRDFAPARGEPRGESRGEPTPPIAGGQPWTATP